MSVKRSRRDFVKDVALASAAAVVSGTPATAAETEHRRERLERPFLPQDATPRGIVQPVAHASGIPLGGLGTGSVEIRPDGYFHEWMIFNLGDWADENGPNFPPMPPMPPSALAFFLRAKTPSGEPLMRRLGVRSDQTDLYSLSWLQPVETVEFEGRTPTAKLTYRDASLPVAVEALAYSPLIPHDARTSGTPGFTMAFTVRNTSREPVEVSLAGRLKNPVAWGEADRQLVNRLIRDGEAVYLHLTTDVSAAKPTIGSMCFAVAGGEPSWIAGEYAPYLGGFSWGSGRYNAEFAMPVRLRETGRLHNAEGDRRPAFLPATDEAIDALDFAALGELATRLRRYAFFGEVYDRLARVQEGDPGTQAGLAAYLKDCRHYIAALDRTDHPGERWGDTALCSSFTLRPGESRDVRFVVAWHFPHHFSTRGPEMGHMYERWFPDALAVARFLNDNAAAHREAVLSFADTLADTTLGRPIAEAWSSQLTTLVKSTWWTRRGDFAVWEGFGCCGFHTMDVSYQGSYSIMALYPELQLSQMRLGARFQRADGRVHHFFTPDFDAVDNQFERVDMNPQFVLMVCRDWLWTGDRDYLRQLWPNVTRALDVIAQLDSDGDGLPDRDTRRNTYDVWDFLGTPSYIASLWLAGWKAGARLAEDMGDEQRAAQYREKLERGRAAFLDRLWNGEYFSLWVDGERRDECCMTDQLSGEWYTRLMGLGNQLPEERILQALRAVYRYNFTPEQGLVNATYPPGRAPRIKAFGNFQAAGNWTGIEYATASLWFDHGMVPEAFAVVEAVDRRYRRAGRIWNHVECGDHYYRAMCSWATLLGVTGFKMDAPRGRLTVAPAVRQAELRAPWCSATGWGTIVQGARRLELACRSGRLTVGELVTALPAGRVTVSLDGTRLACSPLEATEGAAMRFESPVTIEPGRSLVVRT